MAKAANTDPAASASASTSNESVRLSKTRKLSARVLVLPTLAVSVILMIVTPECSPKSTFEPSTKGKAEKATTQAETPAIQRQTQEAEDIRTGRQGKKVLVAPVGRWSKTLTLPRNVNFRILPQGKINIQTLSGKIIEDGSNEIGSIGENLPIKDSVLRFESRENTPIDVVVEWKRR